jgi:hypothetical protein
LKLVIGTLCPQKLELTSLTSGGRLVGIVHLRIQATEFSFNGNGIRIVNFIITKTLLVKSMLFTHCSIPKFALNHLLYDILPAHMPSKYDKHKIYKTLFLPLVLC